MTKNKKRVDLHLFYRDEESRSRVINFFDTLKKKEEASLYNDQWHGGEGGYLGSMTADVSVDEAIPIGTLLCSQIPGLSFEVDLDDARVPFTQCAGVFVVDSLRGKVLAVSHWPQKNDWVVPFIEQREGEAFEETAIRAAKTVTGLTVKSLRYVHDYKLNDEKWLTVFFAEAEGELEGDGCLVGSKVSWVALHEIAESHCTYHEFNRGLIGSLLFLLQGLLTMDED